MYGRLGTPEIRVQASFAIIYIQGGTFKIKCYFVLVVRCCQRIETTPTCPTI